MSDGAWQIVVAGIVSIVTTIASVVASYIALRREILANDAASRERAAQQTRKMNEMAANVERVHLATNSLTDRLVAKTEVEALARGKREEKKRAAVEGPEA